jgi:hypothetical protein
MSERRARSTQVDPRSDGAYETICHRWVAVDGVT